MLNKVMIIGRLGRDPDLRYSQGGQPVANLNVATDESWTDRDGNKIDKTEWHKVVVWGKMAENCSTYLSKGSLVYVEGSLQTRKWQDAQGQDRYTTDIRAQRVQFLDRKGDNRLREQGDSFDDGYDMPPPRGRQGQPQRQTAATGRGRANESMGPAFPSEASQLDDVPWADSPMDMEQPQRGAKKSASRGRNAGGSGSPYNQDSGEPDDVMF